MSIYTYLPLTLLTCRANILLSWQLVKRLWPLRKHYIHCFVFLKNLNVQKMVMNIKTAKYLQRPWTQTKEEFCTNICWGETPALRCRDHAGLLDGARAALIILAFFAHMLEFYRLRRKRFGKSCDINSRDIINVQSCAINLGIEKLKTI